MPIPKKRKDEDKQAFVSRCMGDSVMKKDYPNNQQRVAICLDQATADCGCVEAADFKMQIELYGYEEEITEDNFYGKIFAKRKSVWVKIISQQNLEIQTVQIQKLGKEQNQMVVEMRWQ